MNDRLPDPAASGSLTTAARERTRALAITAILVFGVDASDAALASSAVTRASAIGFALASGVALALALAARPRASAWTLVITLLVAGLRSAATSGLAGQGPELLLLGLAPLLAATMLDRPALWIATVGVGVALVIAIVVDLAGSAAPVQLWAHALPAFVALAVLVTVLELVGLRERDAVATLTRKNVALARAQDRQVQTEQDRANLERAVAQAQRLESLGRLAGSIAHDFNNMLGGIRGNIELAAMLDDPEGGDQRLALLETANQLIDRAAVLTRNLLRFAKGRPVDAELVDIHELLEGAETIYRSVVGNHVVLSVELAATRSTIAFNPGQFEQLLLNLLVNASDAMPHGGDLCVATRDLDDGRLELCVSDTGQGMSDSIQVMIFQPFFTTKGKGTGIGLATVHDIVTAAGGEIRIESEVGQGTRFCVLLPTPTPTPARVGD